MEDKIIASYLKTDGSTGQFLPHNEKSRTAHWDSKTGLTLSGENREQFFPNHRILEVNRFTDTEAYAWYAIQQDPVIDQFYDGDKAELKKILLEISEQFDRAEFQELKQWITENFEIEMDAVKGSLVRIAFNSEMIEPEHDTDIKKTQRQEIEA